MDAGKETAKPKRPRTGGRSARVVQSVLDATIAELALSGYAGLNMEAVAVRAGVNKTTVYRRWPRKADLVKQAILALADQHRVIPNTGALRSDLLVALRQFAETVSSLAGRSILNTLLIERTDPEVAELARSLRLERESVGQIVLRKAVERGELPAAVDLELVHLALLSSVRQRVMTQPESVNDDFLRRLIELVLVGALRSG